MKHDFSSIKSSTFDPILPPNADPERVGLIAVKREAEEDWGR